MLIRKINLNLLVKRGAQALKTSSTGSIRLNPANFSHIPDTFLSLEQQELLELYKKQHPKLKKPVQWAIKRGMDYAGGSILLIASSPVMLLEAAAIKLESKGPVIFKQIRPGKDGNPFVIYKFRSMYEVSPSGPQQNNADRITRVGKIIRKYSIDELPQLFNILKGDMSFIGPRPMSNTKILALDKHAVRRLTVQPGGKIDYDFIKDENLLRNIEQEKEWLENWSLLGDAKILLRIVKDVATGNNR